MQLQNEAQMKQGRLLLNSAKQTHQKTTETRGKNFLWKIFRCRDEPIKRMETRPRRKHTRSLPHYRNMVEKKKTQRLPSSVAHTCNRCRVVFGVFLFSTIFPYWGSLLVCFHLGLVSIPFIGLFLYLKILTENFYPLFFWLVCFAEFNSNHPRFICASFCSPTR